MVAVFAARSTIELENCKLTVTRDYLLPKLLAGEIRIGLAEDLVDESALTA